jgi:hypothetical protein
MHRISHFIITASLCTALYPSSAQPWPLVQIGTSQTGTLGPCEAEIAIDPLQNRRMIVGAVLRYVYTSEDGGQSWTAAEMSSPLGVYGDPCLVASPDGRFHYFHLSDPDQKGWGSPRFLDRIAVQTLRPKKDKALSEAKWSKGKSIGHRPPKQQDKEWADVSEDGKTMYVAWTEFDRYGSKQSSDRSRIRFSAGRKGGAKWSEAISVSRTEGDCLDGDQTAEGATPAAGPGDAVYLSWALDGRIYFSASADRGKTWTDERVVAEQKGGWSQDVPGFDRSNGMPVLVCDRSRSPHSGSLYLLYTEQVGEDIDVLLMISRDQGQNWSAPRSIHPRTDSSAQFMPWIAVDSETGWLHAVYYDRKRRAGEEQLHPWATHTHHAWSNDGGLHWFEERLSLEAFVPSPKAFMGDYNAIDAVGGVVRPVWTELRDGKLSIWTSLIDFKTLPSR